MSSTKRGSAADAIYETHLFGAESKYRSNPSVNRETAIGMSIQRILSELVVSRFKWDGLPDSIDARFLEMTLFYTGLAVVYWDKDYDKLLAVRGSGTGYVNMLDNPVSFSVIGPGSIAKPLTDTAPAQFQNKTIPAYQPASDEDLDQEEKKLKAFPVWSNYMRAPDIDIIQIYSTRLAWIDRTIEINSKNARRNKILRTTPNTVLSGINLARSIDQGEELIQVTGALGDEKTIEAIDMGISPEQYLNLHILRQRIWSEVMGLFGIDNANQDKKERLVAAEVGANDSQTDSMRHVSLISRQQAAEQINEVFGLDISVDFNTEVEAKEAVEDAQQSAMQQQQNQPAPIKKSA